MCDYLAALLEEEDQCRDPPRLPSDLGAGPPLTRELDHHRHHHGILEVAALVGLVVAAVVLLTVGVVMAVRGADPSDGESRRDSVMSTAWEWIRRMVPCISAPTTACSGYPRPVAAAGVADRDQDSYGVHCRRPYHFPRASGHPGKGQDGPHRWD